MLKFRTFDPISIALMCFGVVAITALALVF